MKVLQGVSGQAGQPWALAEGLREIGLDAESVTIAAHKFGYRTHRMIDISSYKEPGELYKALRPLIEEFDVFHFHARSFMINWPSLAFPSLQDIALIKMHGKKVFFHFRGQEIRLAEVFRRVNPFHYADDESKHLFDKMPDYSKIVLRDTVQSLCDGVFVVDPELQTYVPGSVVVPRALDPRDWENVGVDRKSRPLVVHAPSRRGVKGTGPLLQAVTDLKKSGLDFDFVLVENMPHDEAKEVYRRADIVIDQLRIGWYGVLATECLAMGKPVLAYIRDDIWVDDEASLPIINANTSNIEAKLRDIIVDIDKRERLASLARPYFDRTHSAPSIARNLQKLYSAPRTEPDLSGYIAMQSHQHAVTKRWARKEALAKGASPKAANASADNMPLARSDLLVTKQTVRTNRDRLAHMLAVRRADGNRAALTLIQSWLHAKFAQR